MIEAITFWLAKALADFLIFVGVIFTIIVIAIIIGVYVIIKQKLCKHTAAYDNQFPRKFRGDYHCPDCDLDFDKPKDKEEEK